MRNWLNLILILTLVAILVAACGSGTTPIGKILENPRDYVDKTVVVSGEVQQVFGLVFVKYFVLEDKTGRITVVTDEPLPRVGARVKVRGIVRDAFSLGDEQLLVLVEHEK